MFELTSEMQDDIVTVLNIVIEQIGYLPINEENTSGTFNNINFVNPILMYSGQLENDSTSDGYGGGNTLSYSFYLDNLYNMFSFVIKDSPYVQTPISNTVIQCESSFSFNYSEAPGIKMGIVENDTTWEEEQGICPTLSNPIQTCEWKETESLETINASASINVEQSVVLGNMAFYLSFVPPTGQNIKNVTVTTVKTPFYIYGLSIDNLTLDYESFSGTLDVEGVKTPIITIDDQYVETFNSIFFPALTTEFNKNLQMYCYFVTNQPSTTSSTGDITISQY